MTGVVFQCIKASRQYKYFPLSGRLRKTKFLSLQNYFPLWRTDCCRRGLIKTRWPVIISSAQFCCFSSLFAQCQVGILSRCIVIIIIIIIIIIIGVIIILSQTGLLPLFLLLSKISLLSMLLIYIIINIIDIYMYWYILSSLYIIYIYINEVGVESTLA